MHDGNLKSLLVELRAHLLDWAPLWRHSVLDDWGTIEPWLPEAWLHWAQTVALTDRYAFSRTGSHERAPASLVEFANRSLSFERRVPHLFGAPPLPAHWAKGLTPKKKHEIEHLLFFLDQQKPGEVLDIAGGSGHLARHLARALRCPVHSIDQNPALHKSGQQILESPPWSEARLLDITFFTAQFPGQIPDSMRARFQTKGSWSVGLHTCGALAWRHLEIGASSCGGILNLGCCFELLDPQADTNRSAFCRENPIPHNEESLFLANRGGLHEQYADFSFQDQVLNYRYTFDLLLRESGLGSESRSVGTAPTQDYQKSFFHYSEGRLQALGKPQPLELTEKAAEQFYLENSERASKLKAAALLRNFLSRPLALSLILDRAIWLAEQTGQPAQVLAFFDPSLSPRNLGIWQGGKT
jgi:hypothetical protein